MKIKCFLLFLFAMMSICNASAQTVDQTGVAYRYNGKKQRTPLGGVYIKVATSPNGIVSEEKNGKFVLKLKGIGMGYAVVKKKAPEMFCSLRRCAYICTT